MWCLSISAQSTVKDDRDGTEYGQIVLHELIWMDANLQLKTESSRYYDSTDQSLQCGIFYTLEEAMSICPAGWRLPKEEEVKELIKLDKRGKIDLMDTLRIDFCGRIDYEKASRQGSQNTFWIEGEREGTYITHWHFSPEEIKMHHHNVANKMFPVRCVKTAR